MNILIIFLFTFIFWRPLCKIMKTFVVMDQLSKLEICLSKMNFSAPRVLTWSLCSPFMHSSMSNKGKKIQNACYFANRIFHLKSDNTYRSHASPLALLNPNGKWLWLNATQILLKK
jgi:hypothetical protein